MRQKNSLAAAILLLLFLGLSIHWELAWLQENLASPQMQSSDLEQAREYFTLYENIWKDLTYFPVPLSTENPRLQIQFEDSWMFERSYGGSYGHEGTDLMPDTNVAGFYPVLSMTDGVVENIGWLEKGGYRIGIRSPHDVYFYYAHLDSYAKDFQIGDVVKAGELLGLMGDTGYGTEGTRGKFAVHLHVGIYLRTDQIPEIAVNPYWFLRYLEERKLSYAYE
ncbi:MAG: M23 family metallopeptidase [Lachnospiraceae bacterium]|nr:M23 family metallopeptidase [Lachnospiraceae bacterium]